MSEFWLIILGAFVPFSPQVPTVHVIEKMLKSFTVFIYIYEQSQKGFSCWDAVKMAI